MNEAMGPDSEGLPFDPGFEALVQAFLERYRRGERPSISEYMDAHPEQAEKIREFFPGLVLLEEFQTGGHEGNDAFVDPVAQEAGGVREPRRLGEYRLLREIGRGGMGVVYEAVQEPLERRVALKVLPFHSLLDERLLERFRREAKAAARLDHPSIVPVHGLGVHDGIHYYTMQFIQGRGINEIVLEIQRLRSSQSAPECDGANPPRDEVTTSLAVELLTGQFEPVPTVHSEHGVMPLQGGAPVDSVCDQHGAADQHAAPDSPAANRCSDSLLVASSRRRAEAPSAIGSREPYWHCVARIGHQVAEALSYAHGEGILHRDIKPSNLLLGTRARVWVTDFGLAKAEGTEDLTQSWEIVGTLRYMAPERFQGCSDPRTDIYSLGMTLYQLVTLQPPFADSDRGQLLKKIVEEQPPRPRSLNRHIPRDLEAIVLKATRREATERYQTAAELAVELKRFLSGMPIRARSPQLGYLMRHFLKRYRAAAVVALLLGLLLGAVFVKSWLASFRALGPSTLAVEDLDGDGHLDIAVANYDSRNISVLLMRGKSSVRVRTYEVGEGPQSISAADLNNDGQPDLVATNSGSNTVSLLMNRGGGSYGTAIDIRFEGDVFSTTTADLDNDEYVDLAVVGGKNKLWVLVNRGDATFERRVFEVGGNPNFIAVADWNGDGNLDLITANAGSRSISLLGNRGDAHFDKARNLLATSMPMRLTAEDLDGDGDLDLASANYMTASVSVHLNEGGGNYAPPVIYPVEDSVQAVISGDLDGDGDVDLAMAGGEDHVALLLNKGKGTFAQAAKMVAGDKPSSLAAVDWNRDGALDLILSNYGSHSVSVLLNKGGARFEEDTTLSVSPW